MTGAIDIEIAEADGVVYAGVFRDGQATDLSAERRDQAGLVGSVYAAHVRGIDRMAGAAFLDVGLDRPAYLPLRAAHRDLVEGGMAIAQIVAPARDDKGPEATLDIALAGRYLVRVPLSGDVAVSRALGAEARRRWRAALGPGWIVRTAAEAAPDGTVEDEAGHLAARWAGIEGRFASTRAPTLLERGPGVARRAVLDNPAAGLVRLDRAATDPALAPWLRSEVPAPVPRLDVGATDIPDLLPGLLAPVVPLPSGGTIVIEPTRALTAIDVNAGAARDPFVANREAAAVIARQLRLRNIGGIVVIDFISMKRRDEGLIIAALRRGLDGDPAKLRLAESISPLGLVELARERRGLSLAEVTSGGESPS